MSDKQPSLTRPYVLATAVILLLTLVATTVGLFVPEFYRDAEVLLPQLYGQDLLTLIVAVPALVISGYYASRGSLRGYIAWLGEVGPASLAGTRPPSIAETDLPVPVIQSLDLGVVVPSFGLTAYLLHRRHPWAYVFTGVLLVKGTTLGLAVLAMIVFMLLDGQTVPLAQIVIFAVFSSLGLVLVGRFLHSIDETDFTASDAENPAAVGN
jgi:hypothetical protein